MNMEAPTESTYGGEAIFCMIILWLSLMSLIISNFSGPEDSGRSRKRQKGKGKAVVIGAERFCDGSGRNCDGEPAE
ncbi:uncharacterized protein A4U43_C05F21510 [Asparagus officinalis]|uniref:Uncharacterized protein n=1 Tax=Asparagus officinalis TaxID=4686 RepID=A0A5P1EYS6_ASPOF|nr:uncharacterized protein A4U43_C05F21510 [Asparagus officinalis]